MTFNVFAYPFLERWQRPGRFQQVLTSLDEEHADVDVVALQEVFVERARILRDGRKHAVFGLCAGDDGFNPTGLMVLSDHDLAREVSRYAFREEGDDWALMGEDTANCAELQRRRRPHKGMLWVRVMTSHGPVSVLNVHLDTKREARLRQLQLVLDFVQQHRGEEPLVLAGDFNEDTCDGEAGDDLVSGVAQLLGAAALTDASCGVGPTIGGLRLGLLQGAFFPAEIDHVYVAGAAPTPKRTRVFSRPRGGGHLSDHDAVLSVIRLLGRVTPGAW